MKTKFKKRILVTGGAGFIGSNFLNYTVKKYPSELFINVDSLTYAADLRNVTVHEKKNYVFEKVDITDAALLANLFERYRPTDVIHFAAESHVDQSIVDPSLCIKTNIVGTHNLLQLARDYKVKRFHLISTDEVYGDLTLKGSPFTESSTFRPQNPYSASKASAELLLLSYAHTFAMPMVITRSSNNYGPHQDATKFIPKFIINLLSGKKVPLYAKGHNIRNWLYVEENVRATDLVFRKGKNGSIYNIGGAEELTNMEVTQTLLSLLGKTKREIEYVADRPGHDFRYSLSNKKIEQELGWKPSVNFEEGIKKTITFYKKRKTTKHHETVAR